MKTPRNKNVKCVLVDEETVFRHTVWRHTNIPKEDIDRMWKEKNTKGYWAALILAHKLETKLKAIEKRKAKALAKKIMKMAKEIREAQSYLSDLCYKYNYGTDGGILDSTERDNLKDNINVKLALQVQVELPYMEED